MEEQRNKLQFYLNTINEKVDKIQEAKNRIICTSPATTSQSPLVQDQSPSGFLCCIHPEMQKGILDDLNAKEITPLNELIDKYNVELADVKSKNEKIISQIETLEKELKEKEREFGEVLDENTRLSEVHSEILSAHLEKNSANSDCASEIDTMLAEK